LLEEQYVHLVACSDDLNEAWRILQHLHSNPENPLAGTAFKFAVIAYARPYTASRGELKHEYRLPDRYVPIEHRPLHERLLHTRKKLLAHTDLTVKEARVHVAATNSGKFVGVLQNAATGTEEFSNIQAVLALIEGTLESLYPAIRKLEAQLPLTS
jgi:hypothetical protein